MNKHKTNFTLLLLLSVNQYNYINSGIGDIVDGVNNALDYLTDLTIAGYGLSIEAIESLSKKTGLNLNILRQNATSLLIPAYALNADVFDQCIKQMSASGFLDQEKETILAIIHQIGLIQGAATLSPGQLAIEAQKINLDLYKLGKRFRERILHGRNGGLSSAENKYFTSLIETSNEEAKKTTEKPEFEATDLWVGAAIATITLALGVCVAYIIFRCIGEPEAEVYSTRVTRFKKESITPHMFRNGNTYWECDPSLRTASIDTLGSV